MILSKSSFRRLWRRVLGRTSPASIGEVDFAVFELAISECRARGATIGQKVRFLGRIDSVNPHLVSIGDYSVVGVDSALLAHCPIRGAMPCRVGRYVYIAYGAIILPGVSVGDFSLVGAGAVVTKDVPVGTIVAGNPARVIRSLTTEERQRIQRIMLEGRVFGWDEGHIAPD